MSAPPRAAAPLHRPVRPARRLRRGAAGGRAGALPRRLAAGGARCRPSTPEAKKWQSALWEVDPRGERPAAAADPQRTGRVRAGVGARTARCCSPRPGPDPAAKPRAERPEARAVEPAGRRRRGPAAAVPARRDRRVRRRRRQRRRRGRRLRRCPGPPTPRRTRQRRKARKDAGVSAVLHERVPGALLGPRPRPGLHPPVLGRAGAGRGRPGGAARRPLRDLTPDAAPPDRSRRGRSPSPPTAGRWPAPRTCPTGRPAGAPGWCSSTPPTGETRPLVDDPLADVHAPRFSADGGRLVVRPRAPVDLRRAAGLHAAAGRRRRRRGPRPHRRLRPVAQRAAVRRRRRRGVLPRRRRRPARAVPGRPGRRRAGAADRRRVLQRPAGGPRRQRAVRAAVGLRPAGAAGAAGPRGHRAGPRAAALPRDGSGRCPAR